MTSTTPYATSIGLGSATFNPYVRAPINGPLSHVSPCVLPYHSFGVLTGLRPTPPQFYPSQTPPSANMMANARQQYLRTLSQQTALQHEFAKISAPTHYTIYSSRHKVPVSTHMNYTEPMPSSMYLNQLKSVAVGKSGYKVGLPVFAPISTKSYYPSGTRSALRRTRSGGSVAPAKKGSIYNTSLRTGHTCAWGSAPRSTY